MSELVWGVKNGDLKEVKTLVEAGANVNEAVDGRCPIHFAADYGQVEVLEYLISQKADVNAVDKYGITALLSAIYEGHTACVELLIKKGANKNGKAPDGKTYAECADTDDMKMLLA